MALQQRGRACLRALQTHVRVMKSVPGIESGKSIDLVVDEAGSKTRKFKADEPTGYRSTTTSGEYQLGTVVLLIKEMVFGEKKASGYVEACAAAGLKPVLPADRRDLVEVVEKSIDSSQLIIEETPLVPPEMLEPAEKIDHRVKADDLADESEWGAHPLIEDPNELLSDPNVDLTEVADIWRKVEREIRDKEKAQRREAARKQKQDETAAAAAAAAAAGGDETTAAAAAVHETAAAAAAAVHETAAAAAAGTTAAGPSTAAAGTSAAGTAAAGTKTTAKAREPYVLVVPSAATSVLTILNAADLLRDGNFVSTDEKRASGGRREASVTIERTRDGVTQPFKIVDNPLKLSDREWDRVVAVFALGPTWQFKNWKFSEPVDLFHRCLGVHLQFDDEVTNANIAHWNVKILKLSKTKRHLDSPLVLEFWRHLDHHLLKRKAKASSSSSHKRHHSRHSSSSAKRHPSSSSSGGGAQPSSASKRPRPL